MGQTSVAVEGERANGAMSVLPLARRLCTLPVSFPVNKISLFIMIVLSETEPRPLSVCFLPWFGYI